MARSYKIGVVSKLTGISIDRLRAWERRYAAVVPKRGERSRGYEQADIDRLILLRRAVDRGHAISSVANLPDPEIRSLLGDDLDPAAASSTSLIHPLLATLEEYDYGSLRDQLARIAAVLPPHLIVNQVVLPLMHEVGERWHREELTVAQEHMITGLVQHLLGTLMGLHRPAGHAVKLVFTTLEGEQHVLGILAAAMLAAGSGLSPIYLGASLPVKEIIQVVKRSRAKVLVLQVIRGDVPVAEPLRMLAENLPTDVEIWLGGNLESPHERAIVLKDFDALEQHYRRLSALA